MADGPLRRLFWRVADQLDYLVMLAWLLILDALAGPPGDAGRSAAAAGSDGKAAINRYWLLKLGRNHREDQPCRTHRPSSH
jgi:hypothetical protein